MTAILHSPGLLIILAVVLFPVFLLVLRAVFDGWDEVGEAFIFWLGPMWLKMVEVMRGEDWDDDQWNAMKLGLLVLAFVGVVFSLHSFISGHFPGVVEWANRLLPFGLDARHARGQG